MVVILFGDLASGLEMAGSICSYWHKSYLDLIY